MPESDHPAAAFEQAYYPEGPLMIGFESAEVTYTDHAVDLYNSGVNQILSVAATWGHRLFHFSMADLHDRGGVYAAKVSALELDPSWDRNDPHHAHRHLRVLERRTMPLLEMQLLVVRGDDIRNERTPYALDHDLLGDD